MVSQILVVIGAVYLAYKTKKSEVLLGEKIKFLENGISEIKGSIKVEFRSNRDEYNTNSRDNRKEFSESFKVLEDSILRRLDASVISQKNQFDILAKNLYKNMEDFSNNQSKQIDELTKKQGELIRSTEEKLENMRTSMEIKLKGIQEDTNKQLDKMRETVDEKLHKTLESRLTESFKSVSERLEQVHKGLGEMQVLATGVGDLKKVLSNVKTKGVLGEYQLASIINQTLTTTQYDTEISTRSKSKERVEFAIKIPSKENINEYIYLPIDSKFPTEDYMNLRDSYDEGNTEKIAEYQKKLEQRIKKFAKDIKEKYVEPPNTTDFGIMFLPFEGLYAEVLNINGLFESLQRDYKIMIAGPTTISAFLNSLQMGFRTLAIEKSSNEVWDLLGAIKTEFNKFGTMLEKTKKKLQEASNVIGQTEKRTRVIKRKLKNVEELPQDRIEQYLLPDMASEDFDESEEITS